MNADRLSELHAAPAASFDEPFEMLLACHDRVRRSLNLLQRLARHVRDGGDAAQAADAARDVMRYFDLAAPHHHEDEARHVLPRLARSGAPGAALALQLADEHARMQAQWQALRPWLAGLAGHARLEEHRTGAVPIQAVEAFCTLYREHAQREEQAAFPQAQAGLQATELAAMGEEMAQRRRA